jgi:hypothetical protein
MPSKHYDVVGIGSNVELGKGGPRVKDNAGVVEIKNNADNALAVIRGASPVGDDDLVTKRYMETRAQVFVTGQINGGAPPAVVNGAIYICTTAGGAYTLKRLYRGEGGSWVDVFGGNPPEGLTMKVTDALSGGTDEYSADHIYVWDEDGTTWVDVGPDPTGTNNTKTARVSLTHLNTGANNIGSALPNNAVVLRVTAYVDQIFDGTTPVLEVGDAGDADRHMTTAENDLLTVGKYITDTYHLVTANNQLLATLTIGGVPTQGSVHIIVEYSYS